MPTPARTRPVALADLDRAAATAHDSAVVMWRGEAVSLADMPSRIAATPGRGDRDRLFGAYRQGLAATNVSLERRFAAMLEAGDPADGLVRDGLDPRRMATELEAFLLHSETVYFAALRRNLALIGIEQGDASEADLWHVNRGTAWAQWFGGRSVDRAVGAVGDAREGSEHAEAGDADGWLSAKARLAGTARPSTDMTGRAIAATYAGLVGSPAWLESELAMAPGEIGAFADFAAFVQLWRLRHDVGLLQYELRLVDADGDPDLSRAYYAGLLGTVTGVEVAEEAYLAEVIQPFESARSVAVSLLSGALGEVLETRHGPSWWREPAARELIDDVAARPSPADALARLGYDGFDWRPVLRQIRTRLIGEMSGYGGPNITTRAGTRKV